MKKYITEAYSNAVKNNFYGKDPKSDVYEKLKEEIIEFNKSSPSDEFDKDSEQSEIADIIIVLLAYCGLKKYDIEKHISKKIKYNKTRVYR